LEAVDRASEIATRSGDLTEDQLPAAARAVGIGAVKYADLSHDRRRDYAFDWDRMLAMDGNTAAYLQYANCRIRSVLRLAGAEPAAGTPVVLSDPRERELLLWILGFPAAVAAATRGHVPHKLCTHLYGTARAFSAFYAGCPILTAASPGVRDSRLVLAALTSRALALGLSLLGIETPERL
jgi:arginyl-tRNA synthetase